MTIRVIAEVASTIQRGGAVSASPPLTMTMLEVARPALLASGALLVAVGTAWFFAAHGRNSQDVSTGRLTEQPVIAGARPVAPALPPGVAIDAPAWTRACERGVGYLLAHQEATGAYDDGALPAPAVTAFVVRALDAVRPQTPAAAAAIHRAVGYLATVGAHVDARADRLSFPTYTLAILTSALADHVDEMPTSRAAIAHCAALLLRAQNEQGGWRYQLVPEDADASHTAFVMRALAAAQGLGCCDAHAALARADAYLRSCQLPADGAIAYMPGGDGHAFETAIACLAWHACDAGDTAPAVRARRALAAGDVASLAGYTLLTDCLTGEALAPYHDANAAFASRVVPGLIAGQGVDGSWRGEGWKQRNATFPTALAVTTIADAHRDAAPSVPAVALAAACPESRVR